jgi:hypothetical protein
MIYYTRTLLGSGPIIDSSSASFWLWTEPCQDWTASAGKLISSKSISVLTSGLEGQDAPAALEAYFFALR